jgi:hypothetical protein
MSKEIAEATAVIKQAMIDDGPSQLGSYAHGWHCNIAAACFNAIRAQNPNGYHGDTDRVANDAASRFMKLFFGVETTNEPALIDWKEDGWFARFYYQDLNAEFKTWWVSHYGLSKDYGEGEPGDMHEYWVRCAFSLMGWNERSKTSTGIGDK